MLGSRRYESSGRNDEVTKPSMRARLLRAAAPAVGALHRFTTKAMRRAYPEWENRGWSNRELRRWAGSFAGDVINVSGWHDEDKEGGHYRDYFPRRTSYTISNIGGARGIMGHENEIFLDLTAELTPELHRRYDVVFNHTVLEHIYEIRTAVTNLCKLSRDLVVIVVPFSQQVHFEPGSFLDYWRPTPFALSEMFKANGFEIVYCSMNENPVYSIYTFCVATSKPEKWRAHFPPSPLLDANRKRGSAD
jgi:hypothetical protein